MHFLRGCGGQTLHVFLYGDNSVHCIRGSGGILSAKSYLTHCDPMDCSLPNSSVRRQESWSGWPCPPPGSLPDPMIKAASRVAPALQADSLPLSHQGSSYFPLGALLFYKLAQ